jgi:hypothetical protein
MKTQKKNRNWSHEEDKKKCIAKEGCAIDDLLTEEK